MTLKNFFKKLNFAYLMFIKIKKNVCVTLSDGANLYVDVFTPKGKGPWPVILTAIPYHKDDVAGGSSIFESYSYLKAGYAIVLADLRGHGSSDGITQEPLDCLHGHDLFELVEWCAHQKWSNGKVGMKGESYGGMSALQAAAMNPPSLKAIYDFMAPAFFYQNLAFPGGSFNMIGMCGAWLGFMNLITLFPPMYIKKRPEWRNVWEKRLEAYIPYLLIPSEHITYDEYWKQVDIPVQNIKIPTCIMEGWWDFARDDGFQIYKKIQGPKKLKIGPWVHIFPSYGMVEQIDEVYDAIRWFDYWLKDKDTGIMDEPPLSIYVMGADFWKYEKEWPPKRAKETIYYLQSDGTLGIKLDANEKTLSYKHEPAVGMSSGLMIVYPLGLDYPLEQSEDNFKSLAFETPILKDSLEIVGTPSITITLSTDMPDAAITVKLCDISSDGKSNLITSGSLRLSFRESNENPKMPESGKVYNMTLKFFNTDYQLKIGHRLRLCISLSDFPRCFPLPYQGQINLLFGPENIQKLVLNTIIGEKQVSYHPKFQKPDFSFIEYLMKGQKPPLAELKVLKDEKIGKITVHGEVGYEIPLMHLKSPLILSNYYDASVIKGKPETAEIESTGKAKFLLGGQQYFILINQIVRQKEVKISAKIEVDDKIYYKKDFQKSLGWTSLSTY